MVPARTNAIGVASHPIPDRRVEWGLSSLRNRPEHPEHYADSLVANMGKNGGTEACLWRSTACISVVVMAPTSLPLHPPSSGCHGDPYTLRPDGSISRYLSLGICAGNGVFVQLTLDTMAQLFHDRALHRDRDEPSLSEHCDNPLCASITDLGTCVQSIIVLDGGIGHVALRCRAASGTTTVLSLPGPPAV